MSDRLAGKVSIITGSAMGIGHTMALLFAREGAKVIVADIEAGPGEETVSEIRKAGGEAIFAHTDISVEADVANMVAQTMAAFGRLDVLCNNAALALAGHGDGPVTDIAEEVWDRIQAVDLKGTFLCCKHGIPKMIEVGGGSIVNISSMAGILGRLNLDAYTAAKGGMQAMTRSMAAEFAPHKIRCNVICPSGTVTPMSEEFFSDPKTVAHYMTPIGRMGRPEDTAYCAIYLASDESSWITGQTFILDGGQSIQG